MKKRLFSMLLVVCMVFTLFPTVAFAVEGDIPVDTSNVQDSGTPATCPHTERDNSCGYIKAVEGVDCDHLNEDGTYSCNPSVSGNEASPSDAEYVCDHEDDCGFTKAVAGSPCTHECELCSTQGVPPVGEDSILPPAKECDCTMKCNAEDTEDMDATTGAAVTIKPDCPVCGAEGADLTQCKGEAPALLKTPRTGETVYNNLGKDGNTSAISATLSADGTTLAITGSGAMKDWTQESDVPWYTDISTITIVTIANDITNIGNFAFTDCTELTSVTIPDSVTTIGWYAFGRCIKLTSITIPKGVTAINGNAFDGCTLLANVTFADGIQLESLGGGAFRSCKALTSITIPEGVETIEGDTFAYCKELKNATIPASVIKISRQSFGWCETLESVTFAENSKLEAIEESAFRNCENLTSIVIPAGVIDIGDTVFSLCEGLESVTFKGTIAPTLGVNVFNNTNANLKIYVPEGATGYTDDTASDGWKALKDKIAVPIVGPVTLKVDSDTANDTAARAEGATYKTVGGAIQK